MAFRKPLFNPSTRSKNHAGLDRCFAGIPIQFHVDNIQSSSFPFVNLLHLSPLGMGFPMKNGLPELAGSSAPIAQSETMIARQRALIARLRALGKPTDAAERVLVQIETNVRLMHKVHQFIKVRKPYPVQGERF
jgi:hypothetical protein